MCDTLPPPILLAIIFTERPSYSHRDTHFQPSPKKVSFQGPRISERNPCYIDQTPSEQKCGGKLDQPSSTQSHNHG